MHDTITIPRLSTTYALATSFVTSATVLALEILAARTLAPALGSGSVVWSALLAAALGSLAVGNALGGMLATRVLLRKLVAYVLAGGTPAIVLLAAFQEPLAALCADVSLTPGAILAATLLQAPPMTLLGLLAPALIASNVSHDRARWSGWVLAAGSAGGIAGALLAGLTLVPDFGLTRSYLLLGATLALVAAPAALRPPRPIALILLTASLAAAGWLWARPNNPARIESRYGRIEVRHTPAGKTLLVDGLAQTGLPAAPLGPGDALRHGYLLELALTYPPPRDALIIGLGGGLATRVLDVHRVSWHAVELDPAVVAAAREHFALDAAGDRITIADGRRFLAATTRQFDLIVLDVCTADRLPTHLFTREALHLARLRLRPGGTLALQFISDDAAFAASTVATARSVFPSAHVLAMNDPPPTPRWLLASTRPLPPPPPGAPYHTLAPASRGSILTDEHFPAERAWTRTAFLWRRTTADRP